MISSRQSIASGFSILAMTGSGHALVAHDLPGRGSTTSPVADERQRDEVDPGPQAEGRGPPSLSDSAGAVTATPGRLMPLLF